LQAAWKVFSSKDYDAATIDDVAALAELSKGTVYLYFKSKADLFFSTLEMGMEKVNTIVEDVISSSDDHVFGVREMVRRMLKYAEENMDFFKILSSGRSHFEMHTEIASNQDFKDRIMASGSRSVTMLTEYIQHGIESGAFRKVNPEDAAFVLLTAIRGFTFRRIIDPAAASLPEKADSITSIMLGGLRQQDSSDEV
jgi:AcrR family transcriptional regulator